MSENLLTGAIGSILFIPNQGFLIDFMAMAQESAPSCALCNGSGWLPVDGTLEARPCGCQAEMRARQRTVTSAIPKRYFHCTLTHFHDRGNISLSRARKRVTEFVDCWPGVDRGLLLMGGCGSGKTHLAVGMLQEIIRGGKPGALLFSNFQDLIQEIQGSFGADQTPTKTEILNPLLTADLLVLDELGSQKPTSFVQEILYYVINTRYNEEKPTIFTTNYLDVARDKEERLEERIGNRLRSRLHEMCDPVIIDSDDYRKTFASRRV